MINNRIKKVFTNLLGDGVELISSNENVINTTEDVGKSLFIEFIEKWKNSWKVKQTLFNKYGVDFEGYDTQIYSSLENLLIFSLGSVKAGIIINYIYGFELNLGETKFLIKDKNGKDYFISNMDELYEFIMNLKDEDFIGDEE